MSWQRALQRRTSLVVVSLVCWLGTGSEAVASETASARPKVGVVLSGGGAKGAAHIGVLSVLEEYRIPVDVITGTSMGAYVGGMYAMGLSAEEVHRRTMQADWLSGYNDRVGRNDLVLRRKQQNDNYPIYADIGLDIDGEYRARPGAFQGQGMATLLGQLTDNLPRLPSFNQLAIPYRAVATDIVHVKPVILSKGHLATAMQASMTVPGALQPVRIDDQVLVDGGIVNNMPVDAAQALGAEVIIAVDLRDALFGEQQLNSALNIIGQLTTYMTNSNSDLQMQRLDDEDVYLQPDVSFMLAPDFDKMDQAYQAGRSVALKSLPKLLRYQLSEPEYRNYLRRKLDRRSQLVASSAYYIDKIAINNHTRRSDEALRALMELKAGRVIASHELDDAVKRLNSQDIFERITYQIDRQDDQNVLIMDVREKSWGPGYLNLKLSFEDDFANRSDFSFGTQYLYTDLTEKGGEWQFDWLLGSWKLINSSLYFPLDYRKKTYFSVGAGWQHEVREFRLSEEQGDLIDRLGGAVLETEYENYHGFAEFGWNLRPWSALALGYRYSKGRASEVSDLNEQTYHSNGPYLQFKYDDLDNSFFPREGTRFEMTFGLGDISSQLNDDPRIDSDSLHYDATLIAPFSYDRHSLVSIVRYAGSESDELLPVYAQDLGGLFNLSGYHRYELNGRYRAFAGLVYSYRLLDNNFGALSIPVYIGASLERGNVWDQADLISWESSIGAASLFMGLDTPLGPVYLAYGQAEGGENAVYFTLGGTFY